MKKKSKPVRCPDCGARPGQYHGAGCEIEVCAKCRGQVIHCQCKRMPKEKVPFTFEPTNNTDLWLEFRGEDGLCGLCKNKAVIESDRTGGTDSNACVSLFCICPSGRDLKDQTIHA
jgi:hypothetical protein